MKLIILILFTCFAVINSYSQTINFTAYDKITSPEFQMFLDLFPEKELPVDSKDIVNSTSFNEMDNVLSREFVNSYLKNEDGFIVDPIYEEQYETGETQDMYGIFIPMYKLPTNGDYVLLVILQRDDFTDYIKTAYVLKYDLEGNFIIFASPGWFVSTGSSVVNVTLNEQLQMRYSYLFPQLESNFTNCKPCNSDYKVITYQLNPNGTNSEVSSESKNGSFRYNGDYFQLIE